MAISAEFASYVEELFSVLPGTQVRKMFGGVGVFRSGVMYGLGTSSGRIALKADEQTIPEFRASDAQEWIYTDKQGRQKGMGYWYAPENMLDDPEAFREWAAKAFDVAVRADAAKPASQRKLKH